MYYIKRIDINLNFTLFSNERNTVCEKKQLLTQAKK